MSSPPSPTFWVIIPAAGIGSRMQADKPKQYLHVESKTILEHTLECFLSHPEFNSVYVGISNEDAYFEEYGLHLKQGVEVFVGGKERADTVLNGLESLTDKAKDDDWVWVHDAARPCLSKKDLNVLLEELTQTQAGLVLGVPITDTLKRISNSSNVKALPEIESTVDRTGLWRAMTPQVFRYADLRAALEFCQKKGELVTDEASAIEKLGKRALMVQGSEQNIKVTLPADLGKVSDYLEQNRFGQPLIHHDLDTQQEITGVQNTRERFPRIGTGFDVHAFGVGEFITLGGVKIPFEKGLVAHSDGDVLLHAIMDALLGALALGDIGKHFPDTDPKWKGANSRGLLKAVKELIRGQGYLVGNVDSTIMAQAPKMSPHILTMQTNIAEDLGIDISCVGVKATTTEKLGFTGRKEGIACQASVLLMPIVSEEIE